MQLLIGFGGVVLSLVVIVYRVPIKHFIGEIAWAERVFGPGGTYSFLVLFAIFLFFFSLMVMTGTLNLLFGDFLNQFFGSV